MADPIEYLDGESPATPERGVDADDVVDTAPAGGARAHRTLIAAVLVAVVITGLLVARAVTSSGRHHAAPAATRTVVLPVPQVRPTAQPVVDPVTGQELATACAGTPYLPDAGAARGGTLAEHAGAARCSDDASACPQATDGLNACTSGATLPAAVLRAVRQSFPSARRVSSLTETIRENGRLWYRSVLLRLGALETLRVEVVQHHDDGPHSSESDSVAGRFTRAVQRRGTLDVVITSAGPSGSRSPFAEQQVLARSTALLAV